MGWFNVWENNYDSFYFRIECTPYFRIDLSDGVLKNLIEEFKGKSPEERGKLLSEAGENSEALKIITAHQELAMEGQTEVIYLYVNSDGL